MIRSKKVRDAARGQECTLNTPACNYNPETTVLAHVNVDGGAMGGKTDDVSACFACSDCHDLIDGRRNPKCYSDEEKLFYTRRGMVRTWVKLIELGVIKVCGYTI